MTSECPRGPRPGRCSEPRSEKRLGLSKWIFIKKEVWLGKEKRTEVVFSSSLEDCFVLVGSLETGLIVLLFMGFSMLGVSECIF